MRKTATRLPISLKVLDNRFFELTLFHFVL